MIEDHQYDDFMVAREMRRFEGEPRAQRLTVAKQKLADLQAKPWGVFFLTDSKKTARSNMAEWRARCLAWRRYIKALGE